MTYSLFDFQTRRRSIYLICIGHSRLTTFVYFCKSNNILYSGFGASEEALSVLSPKVNDHSELSHQVYMCTGGTFQAMANSGGGSYKLTTITIQLVSRHRQGKSFIRMSIPPPTDANVLHFNGRDVK